MQFKTQRFELVEIQIPAGTTLTKFTFPDLPNLTGRDGNPVIIDSIVAYNDENFSNSPISGSSVVQNGDMCRSFLTIYQGDLQVLYNIPLLQIQFVNAGAASPLNQGVILQPLLKDLINVSWTKSFITYSNPGTPISGDKVFLIGVHYTVISNTPNLIPTTENIILDTLQKQNQVLTGVARQLGVRI